MGPTSKVLLLLVVLGVAGLFWLTARSRRWLIQVPAAVLAFVLSVATGVFVVNDYYDYYTSWGAAAADFSGGGTSFALAHAVTRARGRGNGATGQLLSVDLPGPRSGIDRKGLVYLPPQYFQRRYRSMRFPALELFHGTPGDPAQWVNQLRVTEIAQQLIDSRRMGPVVLVMPDSNGGVSRAEECLNTPSFQDDTYVSTDVPADVRARFRVSTDRAQWGLVGVSSGGYCAANLMLRHRTDFGSAASLDGYYSSHSENAAHIVGSNPTLARVNDPLGTALRTRPGTAPLMPFWVSAGTGDAQDYGLAKQIVAAMRRLEAVPFLVVRGARHTMPAIRRMLPSALAWSWQQLCTPIERRTFPTFAAKSGLTVVTAPLRHPIAQPTIPHHHLARR